MATAGPSQKKRKLQYEASFGSSQNAPPSSSQPSSSQPPSSQPLRRISGPPLSQITQQVEEIEDDEPEEEAKDELYVQMKSSIVGVQYYKGIIGSVYIYASVCSPVVSGYESLAKMQHHACGYQTGQHTCEFSNVGFRLS